MLCKYLQTNNKKPYVANPPIGATVLKSLFER